MHAYRVCGITGIWGLLGKGGEQRNNQPERIPVGVLLVPDEQSLEDGVVTSAVDFDGIVRERRGAVDIQRRR